METSKVVTDSSQVDVEGEPETVLPRDEIVKEGTLEGVTVTVVAATVAVLTIERIVV